MVQDFLQACGSHLRERAHRDVALTGFQQSINIIAWSQPAGAAWKPTRTVEPLRQAHRCYASRSRATSWMGVLRSISLTSSAPDRLTEAICRAVAAQSSECQHNLTT
jgi:hypothetical protein